jgi:hypothetical protein
MNVTATLEHNQIVLRSYDHGEVFAVTIAPPDALSLARDLLNLAISRHGAAQHDDGQLDATAEQLVTDQEHSGNI